MEVVYRVITWCRPDGVELFLSFLFVLFLHKLYVALCCELLNVVSFTFVERRKAERVPARWRLGIGGTEADIEGIGQRSVAF